MAIPRFRFALLLAVPHTIRHRGKVVAPGSAAWERHFPEFRLMGDITAVAMEEQPEGLPRWQAMARWVGIHGHDVDGIVIVHDRTDIIPGAVALDLQLSAVDIPIVITMPSRFDPHDWRTNVVVAMQTVIVGVPGPIVLDGNRIVRASTLHWEEPNMIDGASAARLDFGVRRSLVGGRSKRPTILSMADDMFMWNVVPGLPFPPIPNFPVSMLLQSRMTPDWKALVAWSKSLPHGSRLIIQWPGGKLPAGLRDWGQIGTADEDAVIMVQAAWAFGQGSAWKRALRTALERRRI